MIRSLLRRELRGRLDLILSNTEYHVGTWHRNDFRAQLQRARGRVG